MTVQERLRQIREALNKMRVDAAAAAEAARKANAALPNLQAPLANARQALAAAASGVADSARQSLSAVQQHIDAVSQQMPDVSGVVNQAAASLTQAHQAVTAAVGQTTASAQQALLAHAQNGIPVDALTEVQSHVDTIRGRIDECRGAIANLGQSANIATLRGHVESLSSQVPGLSSLVSQTLKALPAVQNPIAQARQLLSSVPDPAAVMSNLAAAQGHADALGNHVANLSNMMSNGTAALNAAGQHVSQIQSVIAAGPTPETFSNLARAVSGAAAATAISAQIGSAASALTSLSSRADSGHALLTNLAAQALPASARSQVTQAAAALDQARQQLPNAADLASRVAQSTGGISNQINQARSAFETAARAAGGPLFERLANVQSQVQTLQSQIGTASSAFASANAALPDLGKKLGAAAGLMSVLGGKTTAAAAGNAVQQLQGLMGGLSQANPLSALSSMRSIAGLQQQVAGAQQALRDIAAGNIPESARGTLTQLQSLVGGAAQQLPGLSSIISQVGGQAGTIGGHIDAAKKFAASLSPDFVRQLGTSSQVQNLLGQAASQFPGAAQAVSQVTGAMPQAQQAIAKAQQMLGDITSGKLSAGGALQQLAGSPAAQQLLQSAQQFSGAGGLLTSAAANFPQVQQKMLHATTLLSGLASGNFSASDIGESLAAMKNVLGGAAQSQLGQHLTNALGPAADIGKHISSLQGALSQLQSGSLPAAAQGILSQLTGSLGAAGSQVNSITGLISSAAGPVGSLAALIQNANGGAAGLTTAFAQQLGQTANVQNLLQQATQQFPAAAGLISQASSALPQLQQQFAQGQALLTNVMSGNVKPDELLKQLSSAPQFATVLAAAQSQFPQAAALMAQATSLLPQAQQGMAAAKNIAASLQSGDLNGALGAMQSNPQVQALLGQAAGRFPQVAALMQQAQGVASQVQQGVTQAKGALTALQSGDYQGALSQVAAIPAVQNLLGQVQGQFPQAAALMSQAQAALPQLKQSLQQANQAMAALQAGDPAAALAQLKTMPAVQNLLAEAQNQFPQAAALAQQAQQGLAAIQGGLAQSGQLITAFQNGDTSAALALLQGIPAVQNLVAAAGEQFPAAAAALNQATAGLADVQQNLNQASALMDAAVAGDLDQLPPTQAAVANAQTAVTTAAAAEVAAASAPAAEAAASAVAVEDAPAAAEDRGDDNDEGEILLTISTPLEDGTFDVVAMRGEDHMSGMFHYSIEVTSKNESIDFSQLIGQSITVYLDLGEDDPRYINGIVTRITQAGTNDDDDTTYILEMRPWFWKLTKAADCRIYQAMSSIDIITGIFDELGFSDYKNSTTSTYTARDYCVQYRETAFNFISRLMEEEGIFYFFTHEDGKHTLNIADDSDGYLDAHVTEVEFDPTDTPFEDEIFKISFEQEVTTGKYAVDDFNFETSTTDLLTTADGDGMQWYEFPAGFTKTDDGSAVAGRRLAAFEAAGKVIRGSSTVKTMSAGTKFTLSQHVRESMNIAYVVRKVSMRCDQQKYTDSFEAIPAAVVFRPPLITPKPIIHGSQTAIVVGKSGEEIWTDKYGRVMVQFHWDQQGKSDEKSSCWIRVMQGWAGKSWGMLFLPRVGDEVVVSFLEGNPDRPLITGSVYNAQSTVPYTLPDDQTKSTIKTMSSKQGAAGNEIRFQDLKDSEEFYLHAQKDMKVLVEHDYVKQMKNSQQTFIQTDDPTVETDYKHVLVVDGKSKITIKGDANEETHTNEGKFTQTVTKEFTLTVNGDTLTITAAGDLNIKGKTVTIESSSGDVTIKSAANLTAQASQALTNKSGTDLTNQAGTSLTNKSGTDLTNQAGTSLTNKASVSMTNDGGASLTNKASATQTCDGGGMLALKGGMVKLN